MRVVFTTYAPPGVPGGAVKAHLANLRDNVALFAPDTPVLELSVYTAA